MDTTVVKVSDTEVKITTAKTKVTEETITAEQIVKRIAVRNKQKEKLTAQLADINKHLAALSEASATLGIK